jgi:hypothetical protein
VEALTADMVRDAARELLRMDNYVRISLMPAPGVAGGGADGDGR